MDSSTYKSGVLYQVWIEENIIWSKFVEFTRKNRAGGPAFRLACVDQERIAKANNGICVTQVVRRIIKRSK